VPRKTNAEVNAIDVTANTCGMNYL
jgi:hypothetical protein